MAAYGYELAYEMAELQRQVLLGRLHVAVGIRDRTKSEGDAHREAEWTRIIDHLLDGLLEVRGR